MLMTGRLSVAKVLTLLMLALFLLSTVPMAGTSLDVSEDYNITDTNDPTGSPRVDVDVDGNYHVVYLFDDGGDYIDLIYRKVGPTGNTIEGPLQVNPGNVNGGYGALAISVDTAKRAHIAFTTRTTNDDARDVYYAQVNADGGLSVSAKNVYSSEFDANGLDIESDASGNSYIVWDERENIPVIMWLKVSSSGSISKSGREISGELGLNGNVHFPRLGTSISGETLVTWQQEDNFAARTSLYYTSLTSAGSVIEDPVEVVSNALYDLEFLEATGDQDDNLHLVYVQNGATMWTMVEPDATIGDSMQIASSLLGETDSPDIAIAPNGDVYITYLMRENLINAPWLPYIRYWDEADESWSDPDQLIDEATGTPRPAASNDMAGIVYTRSNDIWLITVTKEAGNRPPVADLSVNPTNPGVGETVTFDGSGSTDPDDGDFVDMYYFEWGDGGSSGWQSSFSATHSYSSSGTVTARLRVQDSEGLESTSADTVTITVSSTPVNRAPTAVLTANPTTADTNQEVTFNGGGSSDPDGSVTQYWFDFGDGGNTGWVSTSSVKHSYTSEAAYTATLKVKDDEGLQSENTGSVRVSVIHTNEAPTATIVSITPNPAKVGQEVTFRGTAEDTDGIIETYTWESDLGGLIGSSATFTLDNLIAGTHTVTFKVKDNDGDWSEVDTTTLEVKANAQFTLGDLTDMPDQPYTDTVIEFRVVYTDPDNDRPTTLNLLYSKADGDWKSEALGEVDTSDVDYTDGKEYFFAKKFDSAGKWKYSFEFRNAKNPKKTTAAEEFEVKEVPGLFPAWEAAPAAGALLLAAMAAIVVFRRRETDAK